MGGGYPMGGVLVNDSPLGRYGWSKSPRTRRRQVKKSRFHRAMAACLRKRHSGRARDHFKKCARAVAKKLRRSRR
jgi:DNA-binding FadR family transcriptional regulator